MFHFIASLTSQDDEFADDIGTAEVDARIGLRVALLLGTANGLREGYIGSNLVEDKVQRTAQDSLNLQNLVARVAQVVDGADNGQTSTDIGLVTEPYTAVASRLTQFHVAVIVARGSNLVGSNY